MQTKADEIWKLLSILQIADALSNQKKPISHSNIYGWLVHSFLLAGCMFLFFSYVLLEFMERPNRAPLDTDLIH